MRDGYYHSQTPNIMSQKERLVKELSKPWLPIFEDIMDRKKRTNSEKLLTFQMVIHQRTPRSQVQFRCEETSKLSDGHVEKIRGEYQGLVEDTL